MKYILLTIFALMLPLLDRMRGSDTGIINRNIAKILMGIVVYFLVFGLSFNVTLFILFVLLHTVGASIGWGLPVGAGLNQLSKEDYAKLIINDRKENIDEWYVRGVIKDKWSYGLLVRGFLWGAFPSISLVFFGYYVEAVVLTIAYTIAMLLGVVLANKTKHSKMLKCISLLVTKEYDKWGNQEILRGAIVGVALLVFQLIKYLI